MKTLAGSAMGVASVVLVTAAALAATSEEGPLREWRDGAGRVIGRELPGARLMLVTYDLDGRIVRVEGAIAEAGPSSWPPAVASVEWTHGFEYGADGELVRETDCNARTHELKRASIDLKAGTALGAAHEHGAGR